MLKNWRADFLGGLNASVVALPLAMAFGVESGLGATSGIIGALVLNLVASVIGKTPWLVSGPTGPLTVFSSLIIAQELEKANDAPSALTTIFVIFLLAGLFQILFGLLKLGYYIRFVPYPLISGFMSGIGLMMILFQIFPLMGHPSDIHLQQVFLDLPNAIIHINWAALGIGFLTIFIIYLFPRKKRVISSSLIAIIVASIISVLWFPTVPTVGDMPNEWLDWRMHHLLSFDKTQWDDVLIPALTLGLLGSIDTLLTCVVAEMMLPQPTNANRHLIGQGIGNIFSGLVGGLPGAGATLRTILNIRAGATTYLSTAVHTVFLLLALLEFNIIHHIPLAAVAGVLITVGVSIIDYQGMRDIRKIPQSDAIVMLVVMFVTIFIGLLQAFAAGIILASLFFVKQMVEKSTSKQEPITLLAENEEALTGKNPVYFSREVYIQEFVGPLFFGFASHMKEALLVLSHTRAVIFRMEKVPFIDQSGVYALKDVFMKLRRKGIMIIITGMQDESRQQLERLNILPNLVKNEWIFNSFAEGADWLMEYLSKNPSQNLSKASIEQLELDKLKKRMN